MKCPLFYAGLHACGGIWEAGAGDCFGEKCAWWDKTQHQCAMLSLTDALSDIPDRISGLGKFMALK